MYTTEKKYYDIIPEMDILDLQKGYVKTLIADTIETYSGAWRLVHEALQNAHDHIQLNENIAEGSITIRLFVAANRVSITDNGTGIELGKFNSIFQLGGTDKTAEELRKILKGSQGVGIKSTLYTSTFFRIETVFNDYAWSYELTDCYKFNEPDFSKEITAPPGTKTDAPTGSKFTYSLNDFSVQDFINEIAYEYCREVKADTDNQTINTLPELNTVLETYFRTKTYLGCVQALLGGELKPISVKLILDFDSPNPEDYNGLNKDYCPFFVNTNLYGKHYEHSFAAKYLDVLEIHNQLPQGRKVDRVLEDFRSVLNNPPSVADRKILIQKFDSGTIKDLLARTKKNPDTGEISFEPNPVKLQIHNTALNLINGMYLVIAQTGYMKKYFHIGARQQISVNGLPTNIDLKMPVSALAYLNNIHLVLDLNCTLGFGKRNLPGRQKGVIDAFYHDAWLMMRRFIPLIVGYKQDSDPDSVPKWDSANEIEIYRSEGNVFRNLDFLFRNIPKEEQEVIVLFFELLGRKTLKGYFPFRAGGNSVYDSLFYIDLNESETIPENVGAASLKIVEFKHKTSQLLVDLDKEKKFLADIDLLVCWENDLTDEEIENVGYSIHELEREGIQPFPGATWRIRKGNDACQMLVLKEFLESQGLLQKK